MIEEELCDEEGEESKLVEKNRCPYCGEMFENEVEKGNHISEEHVDPETHLPRNSNTNFKKKSIVDDWKRKDEKSE